MLTRVSTQTPSRRIRRNPEQAEREILDAAEAVLRERSFRELSVDELMRRTGMTRSTFYHYFRSLDAVAIGLLRRVQGEMMEAAAPWISAGGDEEDPEESARQAIRAVAEIFARHGSVLAGINEASFRYVAVQDAWREGILGDWIKAIAAQLHAQRARGLTRVEDPEEVARALLLMNTVVFVERLGKQQPDAPQDVADVLAHIWIGALYR